MPKTRFCHSVESLFRTNLHLDCPHIVCFLHARILSANSKAGLRLLCRVS